MKDDMTIVEQTMELLTRYKSLDEHMLRTTPEGSVAHAAICESIKLWDTAIAALESVHAKEAEGSMTREELKKENKFVLKELSKTLSEEIVMYEYLTHKGLTADYEKYAEARKIEMREEGYENV